MIARIRIVGAALVLLASLTACTSDDAVPEAAAPPVAAAPAAPTAPTVDGAAAAPTAAPEVAAELPPVPDERSLPTLMREEFTAGRIREVSVESRNDAYVRSRVTYDSGDLTVSGVLLRPRGEGPFPGIVLNHGYIPPERYATGQGLAREQDRLARDGFVVLHTDYRGHASSDDFVDEFDQAARLGYARDAINAVLALEREPYVDPDRMSMLGRSMGGGVTLNALVAKPDLVEAAVIYASVTSLWVENAEHFSPDEAPEFYAEFGRPSAEPEFYAGLSSRTYFDRVSDPLLIHHGREDDTCPPRWATTTQRALKDAGADSRLEFYAGEGHTFYGQWDDSMDTTIEFLRESF